MFIQVLNSPVGRLLLTSDGTSLSGLWTEQNPYQPAPFSGKYAPPLPVFLQAEKWLACYFSGSNLPSMPPLKPSGTTFQQSVWEELLKIPYGTTTTYGAISQRLISSGIKASPQAVGGAVGRNPISILIPCHRVLGANGALTGYAGGLDVKKFLLDLERNS